VQKVLRGQDPLRILGQGNQVRHYTYGGDLARGIRVCMEHPAALNEDFNISTPTATSVRELAERIWKRIRGDAPLRMVSDPAYPHDVQYRSPEVSKAARLLDFHATTTLDQMLDEVIPWIERAVREGHI
jgi:nucleoside-diphosphate-sugar epimerase